MVAAPGLTTVDFVPTLQAVGPSAVPTRSSTGCSPLPLGRRVKGRICSGLCAAHKHGPATSGPADRCGHRASGTRTAQGGAQGSSPAASRSAASGGDSLAGTPRQARRISVAYPSNGVTMTGFYIAVQEGFTAEEGLDVEMVHMNGTASAQS